MDIQKGQQWFWNRLFYNDLIPNDVAVHVGKIAYVGNQFWFVDSDDFEEQIHISPKEQFSPCHGEDFNGRFALVKKNTKKNTKVNVGDKVIFVSPMSGHGNHSMFWILLKDMQKFEERFEKEPTIRALSHYSRPDGTDSEPFIEFVGFEHVFLANFGQPEMVERFFDGYEIQEGVLLEIDYEVWDRERFCWVEYHEPRKSLLKAHGKTTTTENEGGHRFQLDDQPSVELDQDLQEEPPKTKPAKPTKKKKVMA